MRKIEVQKEDTMKSFLVLFLINVAMLLCISFIAPYQYIRIEKDNNHDYFGRALESYGTCNAGDNIMYFMAPMVVADCIGLVSATFQSYKAGNLSTILSESYYLALAMTSVFETLFLGVPILFVTRSDATAHFLVQSTLFCTGSMTILLSIFLPKYTHRDADMRSSAIARGSMIMRSSHLSQQGQKSSVFSERSGDSGGVPAFSSSLGMTSSQNHHRGLSHSSSIISDVSGIHFTNDDSQKTPQEQEATVEIKSGMMKLIRH
jgi:hypothetical protein